MMNIDELFKLDTETVFEDFGYIKSKLGVRSRQVEELSMKFRTIISGDTRAILQVLVVTGLEIT